MAAGRVWRPVLSLLLPKHSSDSASRIDFVSSELIWNHSQLARVQLPAGSSGSGERDSFTAWELGLVERVDPGLLLVRETCERWG